MKNRCLFYAVFLAFQLVGFCGTQCPFSMPTVGKVASCPKDKREANEASKRKRCGSLAKLQNCTEASKFVYHCVPNTWRNETLEVCAPKIFSQGNCVEFNILGERIQELTEDHACHLAEINGCPPRFSSSDQYLYLSCYKSKKDTLKYDKDTTSNSDIDLYLVLLISIIALIVVLPVIFFCLLRRKGCGIKSHVYQHNATVEIPMTRTVETPAPPDFSKIPSDSVNKNRQETETLLTPNDVHSSFTSGIGSTMHEGSSLILQPWQQSINSDQFLNHVPTCASSIHCPSSSTPSRISSRSRIREAEGYDNESLVEFMEEYNLSELDERFKKNGFNCINPVLMLTEEKMEKLGFKVGEIMRCVSAIESYKEKRGRPKNYSPFEEEEEGEDHA